MHTVQYRTASTTSIGVCKTLKRAKRQVRDLTSPNILEVRIVKTQ